MKAFSTMAWTISGCVSMETRCNSSQGVIIVYKLLNDNVDDGGDSSKEQAKADENDDDTSGSKLRKNQ